MKLHLLSDDSNDSSDCAISHPRPEFLGDVIDHMLDDHDVMPTWQIGTQIVSMFGMDGIRSGLAVLRFDDEPTGPTVTWQQIHDRHDRDAERLEIIEMLVELIGAIHHAQHLDNRS